MIDIRNATLADLKAITSLVYDLGYPATCDEIKERFENISAHQDYKTLLAVDKDDGVAGMIGMSKNYFYEHNGQYIRILIMVVSSGYRNQGIGKKLIQQAELWAREINADTLVLNSGNRLEREAAFNFYKSLGFEIKSSGFVKKLKTQDGF